MNKKKYDRGSGRYYNLNECNSIAYLCHRVVITATFRT